MDLERLYTITDDAVREEELTGADIPNIDLYVDQIINLVNDKNRSGSERYHDKQLTKTMINNYSKDGVITPVRGKKYTKEQITQMLVIYTLKNTLSIGEIKRLLDGAYSIEGYDGEALIESYDRHIEIKAENKTYAKEVIGELIERNGIDVSDDRDFIPLVGSLLSLSSFLRHTAQAMIDEKYPVPNESDEKAEKEKAKKEKTKEKRKKKSEDNEINNNGGEENDRQENNKLT